MSEQMARLEAAHGGRPAREIIVAAINEHGSVSAAARALGVKRDTFYYWTLRLHIEVNTKARAYALGRPGGERRSLSPLQPARPERELDESAS